MALALGLGLSAARSWQQRNVARPGVAGVQASASQGLDFSHVIPKIMPAVVGIKAYRPEPKSLPPGFHKFHPQIRPTESAGSGVVVEVEGKVGYVLTNEHVVRGAKRVRVILSDGRELKGKIEAQDPKSDLAFIEVYGHDLVAAKLGNSSTLNVGDWVLAIGNPFGLSHTVTTGIVSAQGRTDIKLIDSDQRYENFIQTDAAINPGNSGGPLVNLNSEVIGINTAIVSLTGSYQGIGFAIPINMARRVYKDLREFKKVRRGWLGVSIDPVTREQAELLGLEQSGGIFIRETFIGHPSEAAGLEVGDIILSFNGEKMLSVDSLRLAVADTEIGSEVDVVILRNQKKKTFKVILGEAPQSTRDLYATLRHEGRRREREDLGLSVQSLTPELAATYEHGDARGVLVSHVEPKSRAERAGIIGGTLILGIHQGEERQYAVETTEDYEEAMADINTAITFGMSIRRPRERLTTLVSIRPLSQPERK
jgi:serine protease Do